MSSRPLSLALSAIPPTTKSVKNVLSQDVASEASCQVRSVGASSQARL
jgi:hypothetical protein